MKPRRLPADIVRELESGDWIGRLTTAAQVLIGIVAVIGIFAWVSLNPTLLLAFLFLQPLLVIGIVLFIVAALMNEKEVLLERFRPGQMVCAQGRPGDFIYVVRSGEFEGVGQREGQREVVKFAAGDFIGDRTLAGKAPYQWTVRALSAGEVYRVEPHNFALLAAVDSNLRPAMEKILDHRLSNFLDDQM